MGKRWEKGIPGVVTPGKPAAPRRGAVISLKAQARAGLQSNDREVAVSVSRGRVHPKRIWPEAPPR
jgi:hypothetical protein